MNGLADPIKFETNEDGSTPAGAIVISLKNIGSIAGRVNNAELKAGEATNYTFVGKPYRSISYQTNGSVFKIRYTL